METWSFAALSTGLCAVLAIPFILWSRFFGSQNDDTVLIHEKNALIAIYNQTNGNNWIRNDNWCDNSKPISMWYGVKVSNPI